MLYKYKVPSRSHVFAVDFYVGSAEQMIDCWIVTFGQSYSSRVVGHVICATNLERSITLVAVKHRADIFESSEENLRKISYLKERRNLGNILGKILRTCLGMH